MKEIFLIIKINEDCRQVIGRKIDELNIVQYSSVFGPTSVHSAKKKKKQWIVLAFDISHHLLLIKPDNYWEKGTLGMSLVQSGPIWQESSQDR